MEKYIVVGISSVIFLSIEIIGLLIQFITTGLMFWIPDVILIGGFSFLINKTLIKKNKLTRGEWVVFIILVLITIVGFLMGFIIGFIEGYTEGF